MPLNEAGSRPEGDRLSCGNLTVTGYLAFSADLDDRDVVDAFDELTYWSSLFGQLLFRYLPLKPATALLNAYLTRLGFLDGLKGLVPGEALRTEVFADLEARLNRIAADADGGLSLSVPAAYIQGLRS